SPSGGNTPAERPTFEQAFAADASPASDPSTAATASPEGPAATSSEATPGDDRSPFIPRPRFDEVNTRLKTAEAEAQSLRDVLGGLPPQQARDFLQGLRDMSQDPEGWYVKQALSYQNRPQLLDRIVSEFQKHHGDEIRSYFGRKLAERQIQTEPKLETIPVEMP